MALNKNKIVIHRTRIGKEIIAEFAVPFSKKHQREGNVVVLAGGAPTMPGKSMLISFLATNGLYVLCPRYRGSWESAGKFLAKDPTIDIKETIDAMARPVLSLYEGNKYLFPKNPNIYIFASSFGGPAGFFLSKDKRIAKIIAFSPVCDWREDSKVEPLGKLDAMTKEMYGEGYRLAPNAWKKLKKGNFYNPATALEKIDGSKIFVFHNSDDYVVGAESVEKFSKNVNAKLVLRKSGGHMGLSTAMTPYYWSRIQKFVK